jgi:hypothetical protein
VEEIKQVCCDKCKGDEPLFFCRNKVCTVCHRYDALEANKKVERETQKIVNDPDPESNPNAISIIRQKDGNWRGKWKKNGKMIESRTNDPQTVLIELLTSSG